MEIVNEKDLKRFAIIDWMDIIFWDSNNILECYNIYIMFDKNFKGIYDFKQDRYLDEADIIDLTGCQIQNY